MNCTRRWLGFTLSLVAISCFGCTPHGSSRLTYLDPAALPDNWRTKAERTGYDQTGRYDATVEFCRHLADASPQAHLTSIGLSGEGRALPLLILSADGEFTPEAARASGKPLVLLQNCIHSGECAGKDARCSEHRRHLLVSVCCSLSPTA